MKPLSFRVKLALWNVAVLAIVLGGFGLTIVYAAQARLAASVDNELRDRARRFQRVPPGGFNRSPQDPGRGGPDGPRPPQGEPGGPRPGQPGDQPQPGPQGGGPPNDPFRPFGVASPGFDPQTERIAAVRRPRFLEESGRGLGPNGLGPWDLGAFKASLAGREAFVTVTAEGQRIRVLSVPWPRETGERGVIQIGRELTDVEQGWSRHLGILATLLPLAVLIAGIGGWFLTGRALRPVRDVTKAAAEIGAQDLSRRLDVEGRDELGELASTFNEMIARLERSFERQRRFTADASHELRTPLTRIKLATSSALEGEPSVERYQRALKVSDQAADAMSRLVQQLLLLARADSGRLEMKVQKTDVADVARRAWSAVAALGGRGPGVVVDESVLALADPDMLQRVFENLLENAARHTPSDGSIELRVGREGDSAVVRVQDDGEGIAPEHLPRLTERFYRVDDARSRGDGGCGLGLAITQGLVDAHAGKLEFESELGRGTVATVRIPLSN
ncbi:MAG: ATP-binding protein [Fimbriimonadaceae bacterium]|nr:ATP-binding protein [Fimbriimonadaceae bacterium]